jgi:hypothetical protein
MLDSSLNSRVPPLEKVRIFNMLGSSLNSRVPPLEKVRNI